MVQNVWFYGPKWPMNINAKTPNAEKARVLNETRRLSRDTGCDSDHECEHAGGMRKPRTYIEQNRAISPLRGGAMMSISRNQILIFPDRQLKNAVSL